MWYFFQPFPIFTILNAHNHFKSCFVNYIFSGKRLVFDTFKVNASAERIYEVEVTSMKLVRNRELDLKSENQ